jgi:hypothetical protein
VTDDDLDLRLAQHFAATARTLPPHVVDAVLAELPRRGQVGVASEWLRRTGRVAAAAGLAAAMILAVAVGPAVVNRLRSGVGTSPTGSPALSWDAVVSFREFPIQSNPSMDSYGHPAVWSYLEVADGSHDPSAAERLTEFDRVRDAWVDSAHPGLAVGWPLSTDSLVLEPWGQGSADRRAVVVAWRSPVDAAVSIVGSVEVDASCGDGIDVWLDQGSESLETFRLARGRSDLDLEATVRVGDTLYLAVGPGGAGDASCDTTWLKLLISA